MVATYSSMGADVPGDMAPTTFLAVRASVRVLRPLPARTLGVARFSCSCFTYSEYAICCHSLWLTHRLLDVPIPAEASSARFPSINRGRGGRPSRNQPALVRDNTVAQAPVPAAGPAVQPPRRVTSGHHRARCIGEVLANSYWLDGVPLTKPWGRHGDQPQHPQVTCVLPSWCGFVGTMDDV